VAELRILMMGDTHVGFDSTRRPRIERRRRGPDFLANFERALAPARRGEVDLVVHGGDLLHRSELPASLVQAALAPLLAVADRGVPVFLVPGNHERSRIPYPLLALHPNLHVFHGPDTFTGTWGGLRIAVSGFPFARDLQGPALREQLPRTGHQQVTADVRLLVVHQAIEGARVEGFTFRPRRDVIAARDLPGGFDAFLSGHIHRSQVLTHDLRGGRLPAPVLYPGSIERTSFAERNEEKGALRILASPGRPLRWRFEPLPARPMRILRLEPGPGEWARLRRQLDTCEPDAVVCIDARGSPRPPSLKSLRAWAPPTMNLSLRWARTGGDEGEATWK